MEKEEKEQRPKRPYKIMLGDIVTVYRNDYNGKTFYKLVCNKKLYDNTTIVGNKPIRFKAGVDLPHGTRIRILDMFEDFYNKDLYNTIWSLFINEFEIVDEKDSFEQYSQTLQFNETIDQTDIGYNNFKLDDEVPNDSISENKTTYDDFTGEKDTFDNIQTPW